MAHDYNTLLNNYGAEFTPTTCHETYLVEQMAHASWKLNHLRTVEATLFEEFLATPSGEIQNDQTARLNHMQRIVAAVERSYHQAHRELIASRRRDAKALSAATPPVEPVPPPQPAPPDTPALPRPTHAEPKQIARVAQTSAAALKSFGKRRRRR